MLSYHNFLKSFFFPLTDVINSTKVSKIYKFLSTSQWWPKEKLVSYQNKQLRRLISYSYNKVPYYKDLFDQNNIRPKDINTIDDLKKIPILRKETIQSNRVNYFLSKDYPTKFLVEFSSSGSTGQPLKYFGTKNSHSFNYASTIRGWSWMGYKLGDRFVKLSQNPRPPLKKIQDFILRCHYLYSNNLVPSEFDKILDSIIKYNPKFIRGYPDPLLFLAEFYEKSSKSKIYPTGISTTGNILSKESRSKIESAFSSKISDSYGNEIGACLFQCSESDNYHFSMEQVISEILVNDRYAQTGETGKLIISDLTNYAMPFIRYDTQDLVTKGGNCECGRSLSTVKRIDGRDNDILVTPSGKYLIVHNFTGYFQSEKEVLNSVTNFQIVQHEIDFIEILIVTNSKFDDKVKSNIKNYWEKYTNFELRIKISKVKKIHPTKSGKRRFLIRNFKYDF